MHVSSMLKSTVWSIHLLMLMLKDEEKNSGSPDITCTTIVSDYAPTFVVWTVINVHLFRSIVTLLYQMVLLSETF